MPDIIPGFTTSQTVAIVAVDEFGINDTIDEMAETGWVVVSLTLFNSDASVIILFTRTIAAS